jgi:uncharacterized protein DUF3558
MTTRLLAAGSATVMAVVLLAGCGKKDDQPPPAPTTSTTTNATTPTPAVPAELAPFAATPCSVLTDAQRTAIGKTAGNVLPKGEPDDTQTAPSCVFGNYQHKVKGYYFATVFVQTDKGLASLTSSHAKGFSADYWKPAKVGDHQAIYYTHQGSEESCDVAIGFTDTTRVDIELYDFDNFTPREQGSCKGTKAVAEQVLATITASM